MKKLTTSLNDLYPAADKLEHTTFFNLDDTVWHENPRVSPPNPLKIDVVTSYLLIARSQEEVQHVTMEMKASIRFYCNQHQIILESFRTKETAGQKSVLIQERLWTEMMLQGLSKDFSSVIGDIEVPRYFNSVVSQLPVITGVDDVIEALASIENFERSAGDDDPSDESGGDTDDTDEDDD